MRDELTTFTFNLPLRVLTPHVTYIYVVALDPTVAPLVTVDYSCAPHVDFLPFHTLVDLPVTLRCPLPQLRLFTFTLIPDLPGYG